MVIFFIHTYDNIQMLVHQETSYLAERRSSPLLSRDERFDAQSGELFNDLLVMDKEYDVLFRRLFLEAQAEISLRISSNYFKDLPTDFKPENNGHPSFKYGDDFLLLLQMHDDFAIEYKKSIDVKIQQFIIDYICWRWFETKSPRDAQFYFERWNKTISDIKSLLMRRLRGMRRLPSFP